MLSDLRFACRQLAKSPGFTLITVLTLALGIGLSTTIFNGVNPLLFRALPFQDPDRLLFLGEANRKQGFDRMNASYGDYAHWRRENQVFTDVGVWDTYNVTLGAGDEPERIEGCMVSATLFSLLGIKPVLGRPFAEADDQPGAARVVLLGHGLWQRRFGGDPAVIGQEVRLNGEACTVVGIMPPRVRFPNDADLWTPLVVRDPEKTHGRFGYGCAARLKPGVTAAQAFADLEAIQERIARETPRTNANITAVVMPITDAFLDPELRSMGWTMLGSVTFVLAVACANVASLLLTRALGRQKEFSVRAALGASRWRTTRQLIVESMLLGILGGGLGLLFSVWGIDVVIRLVPVDIPYWIDFTMDWRVFAFAAATSLLTSLLFGLAPAWQAARCNVLAGLNESARGSSGSRERQRLRSMLVVLEVAMATLLLCGTGVLMRSLFNLQRADPGFNPQRLAVFYLDQNGLPRTTPASEVALIDALETKMRALPGVQSIAACSSLPLSGRNTGQAYVIEGRPPLPPGHDLVGNLRVITPSYFEAMQIPLLKGRAFSAADTATAPKVIIIDAELARQYFPNQDPIGQRIRWATQDAASAREIVGVAADVRHSALDRASRPGFYVPHTQSPRRSMSIVVRTTGDRPLGVIAGARQALREIEPSLPLYNTETMTDMISETYWIRRFLGRILAGFAALAVSLAAVGIASVVGFAVTQRRQEIGVRLALGATTGNVLRLILGDGMRLVVIGLVLGLAASIGLTQLLRAQLFGVGFLDPWTLAGSAIAFAGVALFACWLPARRAAAVDPVEALRAE